MRFGVREICDVVFRAKARQQIGNKIFYKNEPVIYFDSLKTSSMEGAATTVYAQGGRGNARLVAWEGERTVTFTMEDALISPVGFSILSGAGLISAEAGKPVIMHTTEQTAKVTKESDYVTITLTQTPYVAGNTVLYTSQSSGTFSSSAVYYKVKSTVVGDPDTSSDADFEVDTSVTSENWSTKKSGAYTRSITAPNTTEDFIYVMVLDDNGEVASEPYIASEVDLANNAIKIYATDTTKSDNTTRYNDLSKFTTGGVVLVDYYVAHEAGAFQVDITPDKFGGNFYLEASTLFRGTNGVDMPAEFVIPNCKVQSNFTFSMASSGDPSTFTFTMDAFPDYTRWDKTKKVYAAIQVLEENETRSELERLGTVHNYSTAATTYNSDHKPIIEG